MSEPVKRTYESPRRREQAAATRQAILEAAQRRFERDGYSATTMAAIAAEAQVADKTVYLAFETKSGVLRGVWHLRLRGDQADVPVGERPWYVEVLEEPDPERKLRLMAARSVQIKQRAGGLFRVLRDAAAVDPDSAALLARIQTEFHAHQRRIVKSLADGGALREGLGVAAGADLLWTINHPDLWQLLKVERGWSAARYEEWAGDLACAQLLG